MNSFSRNRQKIWSYSDSLSDRTMLQVVINTSNDLKTKL